MAFLSGNNPNIQVVLTASNGTEYPVKGGIQDFIINIPNSQEVTTLRDGTRRVLNVNTNITDEVSKVGFKVSANITNTDILANLIHDNGITVSYTVFKDGNPEARICENCTMLKPSSSDNINIMATGQYIDVEFAYAE